MRFLPDAIGLCLGFTALRRIRSRQQELRGSEFAQAAMILAILWFFLGLCCAAPI